MRDFAYFISFSQKAPSYQSIIMYTHIANNTHKAWRNHFPAILSMMVAMSVTSMLTPDGVNHLFSLGALFSNLAN